MAKGRKRSPLAATILAATSAATRSASHAAKVPRRHSAPVPQTRAAVTHRAREPLPASYNPGVARKVRRGKAEYRRRVLKQRTYVRRGREPLDPTSNAQAAGDVARGKVAWSARQRRIKQGLPVRPWIQPSRPAQRVTGGSGPVGTPGGPAHLTDGALSFSRGIHNIGRALHAAATFEQQHTGVEGQYRHPSATVEALAHPGRLVKGLGHAATERQLESATGGQYQSKLFPHVDVKKLVIDTPRALIEHPEAIPKTLKGLAEIPIAAPAGIVKAVTDPAGVYKQFTADANRRYSGSSKQFRDRVGKEGAAAEITDALTFGAPEASVLGRGVGSVARKGALGEKARVFATADRPLLRVSGNKTRPQEASPNIFRLSLQRGEDRARAAKTARRNRRHPDAKPGLQPGKGEVVPLFERRAQRVETSKVQSRRFQAFQHEQHREVHRGAHRKVSELNRHQQRAVFHSLQGLVSLDDPVKAVAQLQARRARIVQAWHDRGLKGEPPEAKTIDYLVRHADKVFTPALKDFHAGELARAGRVGHVGVSGTTAAARRYRPQAKELGIAYPYEELRDNIKASFKARLAATQDANAAKGIRQQRDHQLQVLDQRRPQLDQQFVADVQAAAAHAGLPEPVYIQHFKHHTEAEGRAAYALGGTTAAPGVKQSDMQLLDTGRADTSSQAYLQSLSRTIKRGHNHRLVKEQVDTHAFPNPTPSELAAAFGHRHVDPNQMTADEWRTVLTHRGVDPADYALWSPGKFDEAVSATSAAAAAHGAARVGRHDALELEAAFGSASGPLPQAVDKFGREQGIRLLPKEVFDEIHGSIKSSNVGGRLIDKLQGLQSTVILGTNPSWLGAQVGANAFLSVLGARGNLGAFVKAPIFFKRLDRPTRDALDELFGTGVGEAHARKTHIGAATNSRMIDSYRAFREALSFKAQAVKNAVPLVRDLPSLNPIHLMFSLDNAQNRYFKRVLLYNNVKRQAFRDMATAGGEAVRLQGQIAHLLTLGPEARMEAIVRDSDLVLKHAEAVDNVLGNYIRYTARERKTLKRYVLFYGFMRYSLRTLFYTLPVKHPITAAVGAKLAQLHIQEVKELLGGDETPWAYSKLFTKDGKAIDLARMNPIANPIVDTITEGPKSFLSPLLSPAAQVALNQAYGQELFTGRRFDPKENRARIALHDILSLAAPYRMLEKREQPGPSKYYQLDTLLGSPRPKVYKTPAKRREQRRAIRDAGSPGSVLLQQLLPFIPKQDTSKQTAADKRKSQGKSKKKSGGGNLFSPAGGGGSGSF